MTWQRRHPKGFVVCWEGSRATSQDLSHTCRGCPLSYWNLHHLPDELICLYKLAKMSRSNFLFIDGKLFFPKLPRQKVGGWTDFFCRTNFVGFWQCPCGCSCDVREKLPTTQGKDAFFQMQTCPQQTYWLAKEGKGKATLSSKDQSPRSNLIAGSDEYHWIQTNVLTSTTSYLLKEEKFSLMSFHISMKGIKKKKKKSCREKKE